MDDNIIDEKKYYIFNSVNRRSDIAYRDSSWHGTAKIESENLKGNNIFKNTERESNFEVEKVERKNFVILNHKDYESIHINQNHAKLNQPITVDSTNIRSIKDSTDIIVIEKML